MTPKERAIQWFKDGVNKTWTCYRHDADLNGESRQNPYYSAKAAPCYAGIKYLPHGAKPIVAGASMNSENMDYYEWLCSDKSPFKSIEPEIELIEDNQGKVVAYLVSDKTLKYRWADVFNWMLCMRPAIEFPQFVEEWRKLVEDGFDPRDAFLIAQWVKKQNKGYLVHTSIYSGGHFPIAKGFPYVTYERWFNSELNQKFTDQNIFSDDPSYITPGYQYPYNSDPLYQKYVKGNSHFGRISTNSGNKTLTLEQLKEEYGYHKESISRRG